MCREMFMNRLFFILVFTVSCNVFAVISYFDGGGDGVSWTDSDNWTLGVPNNSGNIEGHMKANGSHDIIAQGENLSASKLYLSDLGPACSLTVYDNIYVGDVFLSGPYGTFNLESGTVNVARASFKGTQANINGGKFMVRSNAWSVRAGTVLNLKGGTMEIQNGTVFSTWDMFTEGGGIINFAGGELIMQGDVRTTINGYVASGNILVNGEAVNDNLTMTYDGTNTRIAATEAEGGSYVLNVDAGADFELWRMYVGPSGTLNINGGNMELTGGNEDAFVVAGGTVNINEGNLTIGNSAWRIIKSGSFVGKVNLYAGEFRILNGTEFSTNSRDTLTDPSTGFVGVIDVYEGRLVMDGDCSSALQWHINNGNIIAYGGDSSNSVLDVYYDPQLNQTTLAARENKYQSYEGYPHGEVNVPVEMQLSWVVGDNATSETLFMAVVPKGDINGDDTVDTDDLIILVENFLNDSPLAVGAADINGDNKVDLLDFAKIAASWFAIVDYQEIDSFARNSGGEPVTYDIILDYDTEYRWRVDTNVGAATYEGNVWTFTTADLPMGL